MDSLKALVAQKRKAASELYEGKKYVKRAELEAAELRRLREEEKRELEAKVPARVCVCTVHNTCAQAARKKQAEEEDARRLKKLQAQQEAAQVRHDNACHA